MSAAAEVLGSLGEATRANQSIARRAAESKGLRMQAVILAVVIPAMSLLLHQVLVGHPAPDLRGRIRGILHDTDRIR